MTEFVQRASSRPPLPGIEAPLDSWGGAVGVRERVAGKLAWADTLLTQIDQALGNQTASLVEDLPQEKAAKTKFASFLGETAVKQALKEDAETGPASRQTLAKSIREAKNGSELGMKRVDVSVDTATPEGWFKIGHFRRTKKQRNAVGEVEQFGLTAETMHRDALVLRPNRPTKLKSFTLSEARNGFREQELVRYDELQDCWFVAVSCVPEDLPEEALDHRGDGFFTHSMTYSAQGTTQEGAEIIHEIIFDRGTNANEDASYEERQAGRFDIVAFGRVYEKLGLSPPKTALEALQKPIKIPKRLMPNGMVDFWRWVDEAKDELRGEIVVRTEEEYIARIEESLEREESIANAKQKIKGELLELDGTFDENDDLQAVEALWELVRKYGPEEAAVNEHIDPIAFGPDAAKKIIEARRFMGMGDIETAKLWVQLAKEVATVSGCGGGCGIGALSGVKEQIARKIFKAKIKKSGEKLKLVEDLERPCPTCGEMTVIYAYDEDDPNVPVGKACTNPNCGVTENV